MVHSLKARSQKLKKQEFVSTHIFYEQMVGAEILEVPQPSFSVRSELQTIKKIKMHAFFFTKKYA